MGKWLWNNAEKKTKFKTRCLGSTRKDERNRIYRKDRLHNDYFILICIFYNLSIIFFYFNVN